ncbi:hypothetical protein E8E14_014927 [Neopestalotiopsis sp. 37M]|nr:hypothetical protein E8E14_014927 [Neopestalotiopsis sp. 37M]
MVHTRNSASTTPWSEEVNAHFTVKGLDLVRLVEYQEEDLHAEIQRRAVAAKKAEIRNHIDRLAAFPFADLDDIEFRNINAWPGEENHSNSIDSNDFWGIETDNGNGGGWGTDAWIDKDDDTFSGSDDCSSIVGDDTSFLECHMDTQDDSWPSSPLPCFGDSDVSSSHASTPIGSEFGQYQEHSTNVTSFEKRLKWKFPSAFEENEKTVAHTEESIGHYLDAADFLIDQTTRLSEQRRERQKRAFRRMTRIPYTREEWDKGPSAIDWDLVTRNLDARMAERKASKKSKLSEEVR